MGHILIGSTAAVSLLLVAWLALTMTPKRSGDADEARLASSDVAGTAFGLAAGGPADGLSLADDVLRSLSTILASQSTQLDGEASVAATFMAGSDRPAVVDATTLAPTVAPTSQPQIVPTSVAEDSPESTELVADAIVDVETSDDAVSTSSDAAIFSFETTEPVESTNPEAAGDSTADTSTIESTSPSTTSTSTSSSTTSSTTSTSSSTTTSTTTSTVPLSDPVKQFS